MYQPQPTSVATTKRATTTTRVGKKLAKSDVGDALKRMVDPIERLEPKMARGHEGRYAEIGAIMCRVTAIDEVFREELRDNEDEEPRGAVRHAFARRSTTSHKLSSSR